MEVFRQPPPGTGSVAIPGRIWVCVSKFMDDNDIFKIYSCCTLCPRKCRADRYKKPGFCGAGVRPSLAKAMLHVWEEPVLCSGAGSGAVFFSNCTLKCVFCQNYVISAEGFGKEISVQRLADIFLKLEQLGAQNIDLITASHYLPSVIAALDLVRHRLNIPIVYNCGGYESACALHMLDGYIDIYLPDVKYFDNKAAVKYSGAPGYFETACGALEEMLAQTKGNVFTDAKGNEVYSLNFSRTEQKSESEKKPEDEKQNAGNKPPGQQYPAMKRGVIVRHMVLPGLRKDSAALLDALAARFGTDKFLISILRQYTPFYLAKTEEEYKNINRKVTSYEYDSVVKKALELGFDGFIQEKNSAKEEYTPIFDLEGVTL